MLVGVGRDRVRQVAAAADREREHHPGRDSGDPFAMHRAEQDGRAKERELGEAADRLHMCREAGVGNLSKFRRNE